MRQISDQKIAGVTQRSRTRDSVASRAEIEAHSLPGTAAADQKTYDGIRVVIKPLDQRGNSTSEQYEISNQNGRWQAVETRLNRIADAKYTTTNTMTVPCGAGWNAENPQQKHDQSFASYAIVVDQRRHGAPLGVGARRCQNQKNRCRYDSFHDPTLFSSAHGRSFYVPPRLSFSHPLSEKCCKRKMPSTWIGWR